MEKTTHNPRPFQTKKKKVFQIWEKAISKIGYQWEIHINKSSNGASGH